MKQWLFEEYCDIMLSIDYEVLTTIAWTYGLKNGL